MVAVRLEGRGSLESGCMLRGGLIEPGQTVCGLRKSTQSQILSVGNCKNGGVLEKGKGEQLESGGKESPLVYFECELAKHVQGKRPPVVRRSPEGAQVRGQHCIWRRDMGDTGLAVKLFVDKEVRMGGEEEGGGARRSHGEGGAGLSEEAEEDQSFNNGVQEIAALVAG